MYENPPPKDSAKRNAASQGKVVSAPQPGGKTPAKPTSSFAEKQKMFESAARNGLDSSKPPLNRVHQSPVVNGAKPSPAITDVKTKSAVVSAEVVTARQVDLRKPQVVTTAAQTKSVPPQRKLPDVPRKTDLSLASVTPKKGGEYGVFVPIGKIAQNAFAPGGQGSDEHNAQDRIAQPKAKPSEYGYFTPIDKSKQTPQVITAPEPADFSSVRLSGEYANVAQAPAKSVEVEKPVSFGKNPRENREIADNGHVATGTFIIGKDSTWIQKNEATGELLHYKSDTLSGRAKALISQSVAKNEPVVVSAQDSRLRVAPARHQ